MSWRKTGFDSFPGNEIHLSVCTECRLFLSVCRKFGKSYVLASNWRAFRGVSYESKLIGWSRKLLNDWNCQIINRRADRRPTVSNWCQKSTHAFKNDLVLNIYSRIFLRKPIISLSFLFTERLAFSLAYSELLTYSMSVILTMVVHEFLWKFAKLIKESEACRQLLIFVTGGCYPAVSTKVP